MRMNNPELEAACTLHKLNGNNANKKTNREERCDGILRMNVKRPCVRCEICSLNDRVKRLAREEDVDEDELRYILQTRVLQYTNSFLSFEAISTPRIKNDFRLSAIQTEC